MRTLLVSLLVLAALSAISASAQIPQMINYQGRVVVNGTNFHGTGQFKFALVDGTGMTSYWSNDGSSTNGSEPTIQSVSIGVNRGLFSAALGDGALSMSAIPFTVFTNSDVRIRTWFNDGDGFQQLDPDQRIVAVGYALQAASVAKGAITTDMLASNTVTSANIQDSSVTPADLAPAVSQQFVGIAGDVMTGPLSNDYGFVGTHILPTNPPPQSVQTGALRYTSTYGGSVEVYDGSVWRRVGPPLPNSAKDILGMNPGSADGEYWIDPDGGSVNNAMKCYCDMTTDGGGWTLVLNYNYAPGPPSTLTPLSTALPLQFSLDPAFNEAGSPAWGHATPALLARINFTEVRFYARTTKHSRVIHFRTADPGTVTYFKTGTGSCSGFLATAVTFPNHTANLPLIGSISFASNQGDNAMTAVPFYISNNYLWSCGYLAPQQWEADSAFSNGGAGTLHQIWVR